MELITCKLIVICFQLKLIKNLEISKFYDLWTTNEEEMLVIDSFDGFSLLIIAGFMEFHYLFSIVFGAMAVMIERLIASTWIDHYEKTTNILIPIFLSIISQSIAITVSFLALFYKLEVIAITIIWISGCFICSIIFLLIKHLNENWRQKMEDPYRNTVFTISQRFQVKENIRALELGKHLIFAEIITVSIIGSIITALLLRLVPPALCHIAENCLWLNPFGICTAVMYSIPAWKKRYKQAFPFCQFLRRKPKVGVITDATDELNKRISMETDLYFSQLNDAWTRE